MAKIALEGLADIFIEISKVENPIHLPTFIREKTLYHPRERQALKKDIWNLILTDPRFTYERTSEIFITKGLKKNERVLDFFPQDNQGSFISHLVVRKIAMQGLSWEQAKIEMKNGKWVRHRFFADWEAISFLYGNMIIFEDDTVVEKEQFEVFRFNNSNSIEEWQKGWEVCQKPFA